MADYNPKRTAAKKTATAAALVAGARVIAFRQGKDAILAGHEAAQIQARNQQYLTAQTEAIARQNTQKAILAGQKQTGYIGGV